MITTKNKTNEKELKMTPQERKDKVKVLLDEHQEYFRLNDIVDPAFIPKMAYRPKDKDEKYLSFFTSELENNKEIYTEFVSVDYDSEDPLRTLYMLPFNPHWKEEYEMITSSSGFQRHLVPTAELKVINDIKSRTPKKEVKKKEIKSIKDFGLMNPDEDCTLQNITLKDIAALWLKKPVSDKKWLNKIIKQK